MGLSMLLNEYAKTKDVSVRDRAARLCIQNWMSTGGYLFGISLSLMELSEYLGIESTIIQDQMRSNMLNTKLWSKDGEVDELVANLIGTSLAWALEDRMEASGQLNLLKASQGGVYSPFISSEVNKALDIKQKSLNNFSGLVKNLTGGGSINIFNNNQQSQEQVGIGLEEALNIISGELKHVSRGEEVEYIETTYDLEQLPEVVARNQTGIDTSKEGLTLNRAEIMQTVDNYKGAIKVSEEEHHAMRREWEQRLDTEEDDPEIASY